jgi:hypothetical protein
MRGAEVDEACAMRRTNACMILVIKTQRNGNAWKSWA